MDTNKRFVTCQQCKGMGYHTVVLKDRSGRQPHGLGLTRIVPCNHHSCNNGIVDMEAYYKSW